MLLFSLISEVYWNHTFKYSTTTCLRTVCVSGVPSAGRFFFNLKKKGKKRQKHRINTLRKIGHPVPSTSVHRRALLVNCSYRLHPLIHIALLGDLFKERCNIIQTFISSVARQIITPEQIIICLRRGHCQLFAGRNFKNVCKAIKSSSSSSSCDA